MSLQLVMSFFGRRYFEKELSIELFPVDEPQPHGYSTCSVFSYDKQLPLIIDFLNIFSVCIGFYLVRRK